MTKDYEYEQTENVQDNDEHVNDLETPDTQTSTTQKKTRGRGTPSNKMGHVIVNAVTGVPYPSHWRVGSNYENLLWKVCDASAYNERLESDFYFYDSPEQARKHRRTRQPYDIDVVNAWHKRVEDFSKTLLA